MIFIFIFYHKVSIVEILISSVLLTITPLLDIVTPVRLLMIFFLLVYRQDFCFVQFYLLTVQPVYHMYKS